jgi:histidinol-phosphate/aromatic aminotransferase/cobyric acid decarboxylase-like protein
MLKKNVRIASAVLDLDPFESDDMGYAQDQLGGGIHRMDRNESSRDPSPKAIAAIKNYLDSQPLSWYPDSEATELKNKLAEYTGMPLNLSVVSREPTPPWIIFAGPSLNPAPKCW